MSSTEKMMTRYAKKITPCKFYTVVLVAELLSNIATKTELLRHENEKKYKTLMEKMPAILYSFSSERGGFYVYGRVEEIQGGHGYEITLLRKGGKEFSGNVLK